ncbi:hypothetical protein S7W_05673 [Mycobacteroides abscessus M94]|uniref:hypothetical protein n=1 Tax=Mycobacteroides abscessus TaxID=36809 RepID=UPI0002587F27|nr:hypothetical protein [Mycobacteroides abscessus]EIC70379.1 hypothetical protein S7W_05673 [Mycobacteroides abscessus M94]
MDAYRAIREVIAGMPGFFGTTRKRTIGVGVDEIVYSQDEIAQRVAAVLPDGLAARGVALVGLGCRRWSARSLGGGGCGCR